MAAATVCAEPGCPEAAVYRGRCRAHRWRPNTRALRRLAAQVRVRARHRCEHCGRPTPPGTGVVDHRVPLAEGGPTLPANLQLLCPACDRPKTRADRARLRRPGVGPPHGVRRTAFRQPAEKTRKTAEAPS